MDPINALSVAAAVVQLVDFGTRLLTTSVEIYNSPSGHTAKEVEVSTVLGDLTILAERAREEIDRSHSREQDELLRPILADIDSIANDFEGAMNTLLSKGISKLYGDGGPKKKGIGGVLISTLNASKTQDMLSRLEQVRLRVVQFSVHDIWVESRESRRREIEFRRTLSELKATMQRIDDRTDGKEFVTTDITDLGGNIHASRADIIEGQVLGAMMVVRGEQKSIYKELIDHLWTRTWTPDEGGSSETGPGRISVVQKRGVHKRGSVFCQKVIRSLEFEAIQSREDAIHGVFDKTFRWIMDVRPSPDGRPSFPVWLEEDTSEPFWITGKPGSGKSTLMKHILHDPQWTVRLEKWADGLPLLVISHYAWLAGAELQKSIQGLLKTILLRYLERFPALVPTVAPRRWALLTTAGGGIALPEWELWELEESLGILLGECGKSIKIAMFVDGLDEFKTHPAELIKLVRKLCSCRGVKVVVASREWQEFRDVLHRHPMLRMQELTAGDMALFVNGHFERNEGYLDLSRAFPAEAAALKDEVVSKANGVFLWLSLVVKSLVASLADGETLAELHTAVDRLPSDISELYDTIWSSINGRNITTASELVAIMRAATEPPRMLEIWLGQEGKLVDLGQETRMPDGILDIMRRRVISSTRGILEVPPNSTVDFLHRTARDWAAKPDVWENIYSHVSEEFDANLTILTGKSLFLWTPTASSLYRDSMGGASLRNFHVVLNDLLPYASKVKRSCVNTPKLIRILDFFNGHLRKIRSAGELQNPRSEGTLPGLRKGGVVKDPILEDTAQFCVLQYLEVKVPRKPGLIDRATTMFEPDNGTPRVSLLENAVLGGDREVAVERTSFNAELHSAHSIPLATRLKTVAFLLERGASVKKATHMGTPIMRSVRELEDFADDDDKRKYWKDVGQLLKSHSGVMKGLRTTLAGASG